jgi:hypothetical protein
MSTALQNDPSQPIGMNFVGASPHVFVYRVWKKEPADAKFVLVRDGDTVDTIPDHFNLGPYPDNTRIAYWIGIAGKPNSTCRIAVVFAQAGKIPAGGLNKHQSTTSAKGGAVVENEAVLV